MSLRLAVAPLSASHVSPYFQEHLSAPSSPLESYLRAVDRCQGVQANSLTPALAVPPDDNQLATHKVCMLVVLELMGSNL